MNALNNIATQFAPFIAEFVPVLGRYVRYVVNYAIAHPDRLQPATSILVGWAKSFFSSEEKAVIKYEGPQWGTLIHTMQSRFPDQTVGMDPRNQTSVASCVNKIADDCLHGKKIEGQVQAILDQVNDEHKALWNSRNEDMREQLQKYNIQNSSFNTNNLPEYAFELGKWHGLYTGTADDLSDCKKSVKALEKRNDECVRQNQVCENRTDTHFSHMVNLTATGDKKNDKLVMCEKEISKEKDKCTAITTKKDKEHKEEQKIMQSEQKAMQAKIDDLKKENGALDKNLSIKTNELDSCKTGLEESKKAKTRLVIAENDLDKTKKELETAKAKVKELEEKIRKLETVPAPAKGGWF